MNARIVREIIVEGRPALAVDTGLGPEQFARAGLSRLAAERGLLIDRNGRKSEWKIEGVAEDEGRMLVYGPAFAGATLDDEAAADPETTLRTVAAVLRGLNAGTPPILPASVVIGTDGSYLLLPDKLIVRAIESNGGAIDGIFRWRNPNLAAEASAVFTSAAIVYRTLAGKPPFGASDEEVLSADLRDGNSLPLRFAAPGSDAALAALTDSALGIGGKEDRRPSAAEYADVVDGAFARGLVRTPTDGELAQLAAERKKHETVQNAATGRKRFFRKHGKTLLIAAAAALVVAGLAWNFLSARAAKFTTKGLTPRQVAETFYAAYDSLNSEKMEACVFSGAGKTDIDAVTNLYVISRVRTAYERDSGLARASEWLAAGAPATDKQIFGLVNLRLSDGLPDGEIIAAYTFYLPGQAKQEHEDRLSFTQKNGLWRISKLTRRVDQRMP